MWAEAIIIVIFTGLFFVLSFEKHKYLKYIFPVMFLLLAAWHIDQPYVLLFILAAAFTFFGQRRLAEGNDGDYAEEAHEEAHEEAPAEEPAEEQAEESHGEEHVEEAHGEEHH